MSDLVSRIRAGVAAKVELRWPGTEDTVFVRVLSKAELQDAAFSADKRFKSKEVAVAVHTVEAYKDEETLQILYRALSDSDGKPVGATVDVFRALVTTDVQTELAQAYAAHEGEISPSAERMSDEDFEAFEAELKKKPEAIIGSVSNIAFARRLLRSLVGQLLS